MRGAQVMLPAFALPAQVAERLADMPKHCDTCKCEFVPKFKVGDVIRMLGTSPFSDAVVTKVNHETSSYELARPYIYSAPWGNPLMGFELVRGYTEGQMEGKKVDSGRVL